MSSLRLGAEVNREWLDPTQRSSDYRCSLRCLGNVTSQDNEHRSETERHEGFEQEGHTYSGVTKVGDMEEK